MQREKNNVSVLFTRQDSIYKSLGVDCWDIERDARNFKGINAVVAHPPCRAWGELAHMAKPRPDEKALSLFAIRVIQRNGGVLEHPAKSKLWPDFLPLPGKVDKYGGYSICVNQHWWGHKAKKKTLLYIVGCPISELPEIPISFDAVEFIIGTAGRRKNGTRAKRKEISKADREHTPIEFAKWLVSVAKKCKSIKQNKQ